MKRHEAGMCNAKGLPEQDVIEGAAWPVEGEQEPWGEQAWQE